MPRLFLRLLGFFSLLNHERLNPSELCLKSVRKVRRPVFEENDEAKREEDKKSEPKQPAQQSHSENRNLGVVMGQSPCAREANLRLNQQRHCQAIAVTRVALLDLCEQYRSLEGEIRAQIEGVLAPVEKSRSRWRRRLNRSPGSRSGGKTSNISSAWNGAVLLSSIYRR